jgi:phosphoserine phosphatase
MAEYVITLVANRQSGALTQDLARRVADSVKADRVEWPAQGEACDLFVTLNEAKDPLQKDPSTSLGMTIHNALGDAPLDFIIQPAPRLKRKLLVADMESTIIVNECLDELAEFVGLKDKIAAITARAMNGELDFEAALKERVGLLKGLPESALQQVMDEKVRLMPGAEALLKEMKRRGVTCMLVSGGFDFFADRIGKALGFDEVRANRLEIEGGKLTGRVILPILDKNAKLAALHDGCKKLGISTDEAIAVGDGANDLPMLLAAGLGVAYHAKQAVREQARARIDHADLRALIYLTS